MSDSDDRTAPKTVDRDELGRQAIRRQAELVEARVHTVTSAVRELADSGERPTRETADDSRMALEELRGLVEAVEATAPDPRSDPDHQNDDAPTDE